MTKKKCTYNIIIPHHNNPALLRRCLDSIPQREDIQVIVVDDNSDAKYIDEVQAACDAHPNTHCFLTTEGRGAGFARNKALKQVNSKWVIFSDADDYFLPEAFTIFDQYQDSEADIICFNSACRFSDTGEESNRSEHITKMIDAFLTTPNEETEGQLRYNYNEPWGKMIRAALIFDNDIQFEETRWANDVHFSTAIGVHAKQIAADKRQVYCVTVSRGSLVHQHSIESRRCRYEVQLRNNQYLRQVGKPQFQTSLMYSLRWAAHYGGIKAVWDFIKLGRKYKANFFIGANKWIKNYFISRKEYKGKEQYIQQS